MVAKDEGHTGRYEKTRAKEAKSCEEKARGEVEMRSVRRAKIALPRKEIQQMGPIERDGGHTACGLMTCSSMQVAMHICFC